MFLLLHLFPLVVGSAAARDDFGGRSFYYGDLHAHTGNSEDGAFGSTSCAGTFCGELDDFATAAQENGLDFVAVTDHINGLSSGYPTESTSAFTDMRDRIAAWNDETNGFVTLLGAEVFMGTSTATLGHRTLVMFGDDADLADLTMEELWPSGVELYTTLTGCSQIDDWMDTLTADHGDALLFPHHPMTASPPGTNWACHSATYEPAVETYSCQGNSLETTSTSFDRPSTLTTTGAVHYAMNPTGYAYKLGFFASTDRHDTRPGEVCDLDQANGGSHRFGGGLAVVVQDEGASFNRGSIYDAFTLRNTYGTSGPMLPALIHLYSGGVELGGMGEELLLPLDQDLDVIVEVPPEDEGVVTEVSLVGPSNTLIALTDNGDGTWSTTVANASVPAWLYARVKIDGDAWWGVGNCSDGGSDNAEYLWLSPNWYTDGPDDLDLDGVSYNDGDCADGDPAIYPGAYDVPADGIDQDCDGLDAGYPDTDGDGFAADTDCDDTRADVFPGAVETWYDGVDQDCAEDSDYDQDGDGVDAEGWGGLDCDDTDPTVWPGAPDLPNDGIDADCDGTVELPDADGDGYDTSVDCDDANPLAYPFAAEIWYDGIDEDCQGGNDNDQDGDGVTATSTGGTDCNDTNAAINPSATEIWYDGVDQNCDGRNDYDQDLDTYLTTATSGGTDCNDTNAAVKPGARETWYDGVDQNCDGRNDYDRDGDSYPSSSYGGTDCNDSSVAIKPGATEIWYDGVDQNCDGRNDYDKDGDGYPSSSYGGTDCDDARANIKPGAREIVGNGRDENCNGSDLS